MKEAPSPIHLARLAIFTSLLGMFLYPVSLISPAWFESVRSFHHLRPVILSLIFFASSESGVFYTRSIRDGIRAQRWDEQALETARHWIHSERTSIWLRLLVGAYAVLASFAFFGAISFIAVAAVIPVWFTIAGLRKAVPDTLRDASQYRQSTAKLHSDHWADATSDTLPTH